MTEQAIDLIKNLSDDISLEQLLEGYKKAQLLEMGESLAVTLPKSWKKKKMTKSLTDRIIEQAQTIYNEVLEQVIDTLPSREQNLYHLDSLDSIKSLAPLIKKGFFFAAETVDGFIFIIPAEVIKAVDSARGVEAPLKAADKPESEEDPSSVEPVNSDEAVQSLVKWKNQLINIYGSYSTTHLQSIWNRYYTNELSIQEIEALLSE